MAPRSGLALKHSTTVGVGLVDVDYRGFVGVVLFNQNRKYFEVHSRNELAQLILERTKLPEVIEV